MGAEQRAGARVASIDIGSNALLMLVVEGEAAGGWRVLQDAETITRVSQGLDASGALDEGALARTEQALRARVAEARGLGATRILACGTAPFRRARNGAAAAARLGAVIGAPLRVLSGEEEARLSLLATRRAFPALEAMTVVDIGGASTEVIALAGGGAAPRLVSADVGSVRLTERCVGGHPITAADQARARAAAREALDASGVGALLAAAPAPLIGIAGTVTTLAALSLELATHDGARVQGHALSRAEVGRLATALAHLSCAQRACLPGVAAARADVIAAGAILLEVLMDAAGAAAVRVSDRGVRWGHLHEVCDGAG